MAILNGEAQPEALLDPATVGLANLRAIDTDGRSVLANPGAVNLADWRASPDNDRSTNTARIQAGLNFCRDGGYSWYLPPGDYQTGPIIAYTSGRCDGRFVFDNNASYTYGFLVAPLAEDVTTLNAAFVNGLTITRGNAIDAAFASYYKHVLAFSNYGDEVPLNRVGATVRWHERIIVTDPEGAFYPPYALNKVETWTDGNTIAKAYLIREQIVIDNLKILIEDVGAGDMATGLKVTRPNCVFRGGSVFSESSQQMLQGVQGEDGASLVRFYDFHVRGVEEINTQYGFNFTASDVQLIGCTEMYCRRGLDGHGAKMISFDGGAYPDGVGGHWINGLYGSGNAYISADNPNASPILVGGGDVVIDGCTVFVRSEHVGPMSIRGDIFEWRGKAHMTDCKIIMDRRSSTTTRLIMFAGNTNEGTTMAPYDWGRMLYLPDSVIFENNKIKQLGASWTAGFSLFEPLNGTGVAVDGFSAGGIFTWRGNTFENDVDLVQDDGNPLYYMVLAKPDTWVQGGYQFVFEDLPVLWLYFQCLSTAATPSVPRHDVYTDTIGSLKWQANYGAFRYARLCADAYTFALGTNRPASGYATPIGDEIEILTGDLFALSTWNVPSLGDGVMSSTTISVPGAKAGDMAIAALATATAAGWFLSALVTTDNTVTVSILNKTGGTLDLATGTLKVRVFRT